jgi:tRNA(Glu) U13 pseudouridine synthase TruD
VHGFCKHAYTVASVHTRYDDAIAVLIEKCRAKAVVAARSSTFERIISNRLYRLDAVFEAMLDGG